MGIWDLADLSTPWCVHVAATLRVAHHIRNGHEEIGALAAAAHTDRDALHRVLRHLARKGVFVEAAPGRFTLNATAEELLDDGTLVGLDLDSFGGRMAGAWNTLLAAVRTGKTAYRDAFGRNFWDDMDANPEIGAKFDWLMGPGHGTPDPEILVDAGDWANVRSVVDVGGGTGAQLVEILRARPQVRGTLVDLPRAAAQGRIAFEAAGLADRVTVVGQSFFDPLPPGADVYVLKNVLADWPDAEAAAILRRCAEAARPNGRVVAFTGAAPGDEADPELLMLVLVGGKGRTLEEFRELGRQASLEMTAHGKQPSGRKIAEFRPKANP
jgi:2,7-dihydroxy-5-methyl-1-naphthoate 7-O-methyltransferase